MNAFLLIGLAVDKRPTHTRLDHYPPITILIAAYNEADNIEDTIKSLSLQNYPGKMDVIVIDDDGSKDNTAALVAAMVGQYSWLRLLRMPKNGGKAKALNHGLTMAKASLVITVDADSYLYQLALQSIVERYFEDPAQHTRRGLSTVLVRNCARPGSPRPRNGITSTAFQPSSACSRCSRAHWWPRAPSRSTTAPPCAASAAGPTAWAKTSC
ncbi:glycosyltransferase family 2 protein [Massilia sp. H-1]|nr:glycosyltransferase family 2 protein [Massilia sp. H-1]